jgi:hypothetical protein
MNTQHVTLSRYIDPDALPVIVERLTGIDPALRLDDLVAPLALLFEQIDPIKTAIWEQHNQAVDAAFAAGLACGLDPERLLLARVMVAAVDR